MLAALSPFAAAPAEAQVTATISAERTALAAGNSTTVTVRLSQAVPAGGWVSVRFNNTYTGSGVGAAAFSGTKSAQFFDAGESSKSFTIRASSARLSGTLTISLQSTHVGGGTATVPTNGSPSSVTIRRVLERINPIELSGDVLASTIGQTAGTATLSLRYAIGFNHFRQSFAQGFTTGSNQRGYSLSGIEVLSSLSVSGSAPPPTNIYRGAVC